MQNEQKAISFPSPSRLMEAYAPHTHCRDIIPMRTRTCKQLGSAIKNASCVDGCMDGFCTFHTWQRQLSTSEGSVKPLRYEETSPTALAQIVSTPLRALCELCLRSDLRTLAPSDLIEESREGLEKKTQFKNKTLSKRGI